MPEFKLVLLDCDCPSVYMPIGLPIGGGSCAFATPECLEHCPSGMVVNDAERFTLNFFRENEADVIITRMHSEFLEMMKDHRKERMIQWWAWGDCLPELTDKTAAVIVGLGELGVSQYGFTRNKKLWDMLPNNDRLRIGLTFEDLSKALQISCGTNKMTTCPDYSEGYAWMIYDGKVRAKCSGWWCITESGETRNSDCTQCLASGEGCYYRE